MATQTNKGPNVGFANPAQFFSNADRLLGQAVAGANEIGDRMVERQKNKAVNQIMTNRIDSNQKVEDFRNEQTSNLANIGMIDPMESAKLVNAQVNPIQAQRNADKLFGFNETKEDNLQTYRDDTLNQQGDVLKETIRSNKATEGDFGTVTTDDGVTWTYDQNTGEFKNKKGSIQNVAAKYVDTRDVTQIDPVTGAKTIKTYTIDKRKPGIDAKTGLPIPDSVQYQQLAQVDKDKADSIQATMGLLSDAVDGEFDPATVGNADKFTAWLDNATGLGWSADTAQTIINSGRWNILGGQLVKTMYGGNASDADRASVFQFVPQSSDNEATYKSKAKEFAKLLTSNHKLFTERINRSNPGYLPDVGSTVKAPDGNTYKIVK